MTVETAGVVSAAMAMVLIGTTAIAETVGVVALAVGTMSSLQEHIICRMMWQCVLNENC